MKKMTLSALFLLAAVLPRLGCFFLPGYVPNFSMIDSLALFSGVYLTRRLHACVLILLSVWLGDILLNKLYTGHLQLFYDGFYWQYLAYTFIVLIGSLLKNTHSSMKWLLACLSSSILFFVLSNFGSWCDSHHVYPQTLNGLIACYIAAIPFFKNTLMSDLFFLGIFFYQSRTIIPLKKSSTEVSQCY